MATEREPKLSWEVEVPDLLQLGTSLTKWEEVQTLRLCFIVFSKYLAEQSFSLDFVRVSNSLYSWQHLLFFKFISRGALFHYRSPAPAKTVISKLINMVSFFPGKKMKR